MSFISVWHFNSGHPFKGCNKHAEPGIAKILFTFYVYAG